jgi:hypothetical protein
MRVFERFTRKGDQMLYEVTVEDPQVLLQPWTLNPMLRTLAVPGAGGGPGGGGGGGAQLLGSERGNCQEEELDDISNQIRH